MPTTQPALSLTQKNTRDKRESAASVQYRGAKHSAGSIASIPTKDRKGSTFSSKTFVHPCCVREGEVCVCARVYVYVCVCVCVCVYVCVCVCVCVHL